MKFDFKDINFKGINKQTKIILIVAVVVLVVAIIFNVIARVSGNSDKSDTEVSQELLEGNETNISDEEKEREYATTIEVLPTLLDNIYYNSTWCGTMQLVWNDMQDEVVKTDIEFNPQIEMVENLNKQSFTVDDLSDEYYYKNFGLMTLDLKSEIEDGIKEKFNEPSDIIDSFDWSNAPQDDSGYEDVKEYFFYVMLYREFNFENPFNELESDDFFGINETYSDIEYFGMDLNASEELRNQVDVMYYNSEDDFAVTLNTVEGDEVVLCKGDSKNTYQDIWDEVLEKTDKYEGDKTFTKNDTLKVPKININLIKEYEELETDGEDESKIFQDADGIECYIKKAIQTIKLELDETGGEIKSEAGIEFDDAAATSIDEDEEEYRYFEFDSTFTMFLVESGKDKPYFIANIDDITLFN